MLIKVLGPGCKNCKTLEENTREAIKELNIQAEVEKVTDFKAIVEHGVLKTPALVVDGKVVSSGKVLKPSEIKELL
ncbi:thioredoxin family protein [Alkaliphilus peptidifermentans]|uniref:Small redox-active disulfide protein 2 n=1 Tax=Alkaliphilus peptidifermentans DSM 18978 TaxID=1120976 RepID=A0A1G5AKB8_9FIRM|nr:thioredoxin family protein [Alkaliphilus peptidifermentans]SCX78295.1 small redox-active disulfide protein 2 [Alkaliphilus peptidifermentans DSM 18978]